MGEAALPGQHPDEAWFCAAHRERAKRDAATHTLAAALAAWRDVPSDAQRMRAFLDTQLVLGTFTSSQQRVAAAVESLALTLSQIVAGDVSMVPEETSQQWTSPSSDWRESATSTEVVRTKTWAAGPWRFQIQQRVQRWDSGEFIRSSCSLTLDPKAEVSLFERRFLLMASFHSGEHTCELSRAGEVPREFAEALDAGIASLREDAVG